MGWGDGGGGNYYCTNPNPPPQYFPSYSSWQPSANVIQLQQPTIHPREGQILRARDFAIEEEEGDKAQRPAGGREGQAGGGEGSQAAVGPRRHAACAARLAEPRIVGTRATAGRTPPPVDT